MAAFNANTTAAEAATALSKEIAGKNSTAHSVLGPDPNLIPGIAVIITGVTVGGIAFEAAREIAKYASLVVITGRNQAKLDEAVKTIKAETPSANVRSLILDVSSLVSVRQAAAEVNSYSENYQVLINNASIMAVPYSSTVDGFESQFGVNHLGPFLFTALIYNHIIAGAGGTGTPESPSRIVNISSRGHHISGILFDDVGFSDGKVYDQWKAYGQSKTASILFANEIARRAKEKSVPLVAFSLHPGRIIGTGLGAHITDEEHIKFGSKNAKGEWIGQFKTTQQGASNYVIAAFDPSILAQSGGYIFDGDINEAQRAPHAKSQEDGKKLWELSERYVKEHFAV